jgi:hypothetical protein
MRPHGVGRGIGALAAALTLVLAGGFAHAAPPIYPWTGIYLPEPVDLNFEPQNPVAQRINNERKQKEGEARTALGQGDCIVFESRIEQLDSLIDQIDGAMNVEKDPSVRDELRKVRANTRITLDALKLLKCPPVKQVELPPPPPTKPLSATGGGFLIGGGFSGSSVELRSLFGTGTVVNDGENFGASTPTHQNRFGFDIEGAWSLQSSGFLPGSSTSLIIDFSHASGSASADGIATIGADGVSMLGLTLLRFENGSSGAFTDTPGNYMESSAGLRSTWSMGSIGYAEAFYPGSEGGARVEVGLAAVIERLAVDYSSTSQIFDPDPFTLLAEQALKGSTSDRYFGAKLSAGLTYPIVPGFTVGINAYATPAYHVGEGQLHQVTTVGISEVTQSLDYSTGGFVLSGGIGAALGLVLSPSAAIVLSYEHSCLGGVTEAHVPANPDEQPASFVEGRMKRDFLRAGFLYRF